MTLSALDLFPAHRHGPICAPMMCAAQALRISLSILVLAFIHASSAQLDQVGAFCRRFGHQTALIDRKLYVDGGFINYNPLSQYPTNYTNTELLYHDLDTPGAGRMPQLYANLTKNATIPTVNGGILWADNVNKRFYLFAGQYANQPPPPRFSLWSFDAINGDWQSFGSPPQATLGAVSYGAGVAISETGVGYYYGGWKSNNTVPGWTGPPTAVTGLVRYRFDSNSWSTNSGPDAIGRAEGAMVFLPVGDGGMLVYFGGIQDPYANGSAVGQPMENIFLYDVLSSKWYVQNATGTIPPMRSRFCAGATWAADQSSYNIYLYGGAGMPPATAGFDDVYVLTIPSFQWIKMFPTDGNLTGPSVHHSLTCNVVDNAQMIIIGGTFPTSSICDSPEQYGAHNVDLGQQNSEKALWQVFVTNLTDYAVPKAIVDAVGGSAGGGATKTAPTGGFSNPDLSVLMTRKASMPSRTPTRPLPKATGSPGQGGPLPTGAIAGIAVGGALVLLAVLAGLIWFIRRHRHHDQHHDPKHASAAAITSHDWSPQVTSSATDTPNGPHPNSPFFYRHDTGYPPARPIELFAGPVSPPPAPPPPPGGVHTWMAPDGVAYELMHPPSSSSGNKNLPAAGSTSALSGSGAGGGAGSSTVESGTGTGTGTGTGSSSEPQTMVDAEGRLWVSLGAAQAQPQSPRRGSNVGLGLGLGSGGGGGGGSSTPEGVVGRYYHGSGGGGGGDGGMVSPGGSPATGLFHHHPQQQQNQQMEPHELDVRGRGGAHALGESAGWDAAHGRPRHLTFYHA